MSAASYYVYELADPSTGMVFYVGKGKGARDRSHIAEARRAGFKNPAKIAVIRAIESRGDQVVVRRVSEGLTERDAFKAERARIAKYGIANLTNIARGQSTETDRAEAMAMDGLALMGKHLSSGIQDAGRVFQIIRELRGALREIRQAA